MVARCRVETNRPTKRLNLHVSSVSPLPKSYRDAFSDLNWQNTMRDEYHALIKNKTWTLVPRPPDTNIVRCMWLFRHKYLADGTLSRYKARLVANASTQLEGIDVDETFSPVVKPGTIRTVLSLAASRHWPIHQLDVKNAFLHGDLSKTVYMHQPLGFRDSVHPGYVCLLQRQGTDTAYLLLYVDDIVLTASSERLAHMVNYNPSQTPIDTESKLGSDDDPVSDPTLYRSLADADWAGCPTTRRSTSGYCVFLRSNLLSWSCKRQPTLSRFSAEAEYRENTRLKELATAVERLSKNNKQRDTRDADHANRIRNVETSLDTIHRSINALTRNIERISVSHPVNGQNNLDAQRLTIASVHFEGSVVPWFKMLQKTYQCGGFIRCGSPGLFSKWTKGTTPLRAQNPLPSPLSLPPLLPKLPVKPLPQIKKLSPAEMQLRREKGLCFTCDETYTWNHKCPNKQYMVLLTSNEDVDLSQVIDSLEVPTENHGDDEVLDHHLSLIAYHGSPGVATICFFGTINGTTLQVLLDGGSSDNYITLRVAMHARLPVEPAANLKDVSSSLPDTTPPDLLNVLHDFASVFSLPKGLPPARSHDHFIVLKDGVNAVKVRPYRYPVSQKTQIEKMVTDMLIEGLIQPGTSPFSAPVLLVRKKDGTWCFCTDYLALNAVTIKDSFPMPTVDELLDELHGSQFFTKLDLRSVYSASWNVHLEHLTIILRCLQEHQLYEKFSKCQFGQQHIEYFGHIVTRARVKIDPLKITTVRDWPVPSSVTQLRAFLRLTGYYRRFIHHYASISHPLTNLLRKDHFKWSLEAQSAFDTLKKALISAHVLRLPDFNRPFIVETDVFGYGIGAILSQDGHPIAFFSKKLSKRMQQTSAYMGHSNTAADGLSRSCNMAVSISYSSIVDDICDNFISSLFVSSLVQDIRNNGEEASCYSSKNGLLYWKDRVVVPPENEEMRHIIREFVRYCQIYQRAKSSQLHPAGLLSPLPIPNQVWEDVAMDFITGLPTSKGYTVIMVVIDRLSKYAHFAALRANYTAHQVAERFVQTVVKLHGIPRSIVFDRDKVFTSAFWSHLFKLQEFWYNSYFHTSIGMTPFKALYGRDRPSIIPCSVFEDTPSDVQTQLQARDVVLAQLKINIARAQAKMKKYADKKRCDPGATHVPLPLLSATEGPLLQPVKILDTRKVRVHNEWEIQVPVQWDCTKTPT
nr:ribonuclease H-like domain-containing protein [Tanacetum cinerariifolium]